MGYLASLDRCFHPEVSNDAGADEGLVMTGATGILINRRARQHEGAVTFHHRLD